MSDNTPDNTLSDGTEPSMEDILASIRRIIADDDTGEAVAEAAVETLPDTLAAVDIESAVDIEPLVEPEIEGETVAVLELDNLEIDSEAVAPSDEVDLLLTEIEGVDAGDSVDVLELSALEEDVALAELNPVEPEALELESVAPEMPKKPSGLEAMAMAGIGAVAAAGAHAADKASAIKQARVNPTPTIMDSDIADLDISELLEDGGSVDAFDLMLEDELTAVDESDAVLHEMLEIPSEDDDDHIVDERVIDPAEDILAQAADEAALTDELLSDMLSDEAGTPQSDADLDLVKSLMADLTDDPYSDDTDADDVGETDMVDEILALSMDDEADLQEAERTEIVGEDVEDSHIPDEDPFIIDMADDLSRGVAPTGRSLAEIANSANSEAEQLDKTGFRATGFVAGAGIAVAASGPISALVARRAVEAVEEPIEPVEDNAPEIETTLTTDNPPHLDNSKEESAEMPKAATQDAIINEVTEEASASAFASLNQMVEQNAVTEERGDRIGDLVQEALRPMLKEWLDKNLKGIVQRAVTKEVKRISSSK